VRHLVVQFQQERQRVVTALHAVRGNHLLVESEVASTDQRARHGRCEREKRGIGLTIRLRERHQTQPARILEFTGRTFRNRHRHQRRRASVT
jgi:hypothetical protein